MQILTRGNPAIFKVNAHNEHTIVEFPTFDHAEGCYESDEYRLAFEALGSGAVRSYKICGAF